MPPPPPGQPRNYQTLVRLGIRFKNNFHSKFGQLLQYDVCKKCGDSPDHAIVCNKKYILTNVYGSPRIIPRSVPWAAFALYTSMIYRSTDILLSVCSYYSDHDIGG